MKVIQDLNQKGKWGSRTKKNNFNLTFIFADCYGILVLLLLKQMKPITKTNCLMRPDVY